MVFCTAWFTIHTWGPTWTYILTDVTFFSVLRLLHKDVLNLNLAMRYSSRLDNNKPNPNNYRFQCYRNLFFVIYGRTKAKMVREPLPSCCVLRVRELFPEANGKYTNFSLKGKRKRNWFDEQLFSCPLFITFDTIFYRVNLKCECTAPAQLSPKNVPPVQDPGRQNRETWIQFNWHTVNYSWQNFVNTWHFCWRNCLPGRTATRRYQHSVNTRSVWIRRVWKPKQRHTVDPWIHKDITGKEKDTRRQAISHNIWCSETSVL